KVNYNTVETIHELEQRADDADRLADSFHEQLVGERKRADTAEASLAAARERIAELEAEIVALNAAHAAEVAQLQEDARAAATAAAAALAAAQLAAAVAEEHATQKARLEGEIRDVQEAAAREAERAAEEMAAAVEEWGLEKREMEQLMEEEKEEGAMRLERVVAEVAEVRRAAEAEIAEVRTAATEELEEAMRAAAAMLASAQEETAEEKEGRAEEARLKDQALTEIQNLEDELAAGKNTALEAIEALKRLVQEVRVDSESSIAKLQTQFDRYRETHTLDDETYNKDLDDWEQRLSTQKAMNANLTDQVHVLKKDKRRLEQEKTYYWTQAEELRISSTGRTGQADPTMEADHALLLEQTKELIEENRELKAKLQ
ncbi:unnamed protein product, partial [Sphacelaria rigidula]